MLKFIFVKDVAPGDIVIRHTWRGENLPAYEILLVKSCVSHVRRGCVVYDIEFVTGCKETNLEPNWTYEIVSLDRSKTSHEVEEAMRQSAERHADTAINNTFKKR